MTSNEELVEMIQNGQPGRIGELWQGCEQFIKKLANRWTGAAEFDDLVQQGFLILHDAAADYEPGQGMKFITYLGQRLEWGWARWLDETGAAVRLPTFMVQRLRQYERIRKEYAAEHGQEPPESYICREMDITRDQFQWLKDKAKKSRIRSLNEPLEGVDGDSIELQDTLSDDADFTAGVLDKVQNEQLARVIWPMVNDLGQRPAEVIWQRYKLNKTLKETGAGLGVTIERVRQIEQKAMRVLRNSTNARKLQPFYDDIRSAAMRGTGLTRFNQTWTSATERAAIQNVEQQRAAADKGTDVDAMLAKLDARLKEIRTMLDDIKAPL